MLILAPMQGLTELLFRKTYEQCFPGAIDRAVSPFISLTHGNLNDALKKIDDVLPENNKGSMTVIPQILGKEKEEFVTLANRLGEFGFDEVNWNIGCPMRRVAAKHRGSGILPYPNEIRDVLEYVVPRIQPKLSIKMRLGHRSTDEILDIVPILNELSIKSITIHPRTGKQQYGGMPNLEKFDTAARQLNHPVIYNGDICTEADYLNIKERFPYVEDVMIGRGILYDPALPLKIKHIAGDHTEQNKRFASMLCNEIENTLTCEEAKIRKTKEYWCLLYKSLSVTELQAKEVLHARTYVQTRELIEKQIGTTNQNHERHN